MKDKRCSKRKRKQFSIQINQEIVNPTSILETLQTIQEKSNESVAVVQCDEENSMVPAV